MVKINVSLPQGTRDFGPEVVRKRNYIINTIKEVFERYGFQPLETPAMENLETLMGKYGEEGDKLIYRILDSGNPYSKDFFRTLGMYLKDRYEFFEERKKENPNIKNPFSNPLWSFDPEYLEFTSDEIKKSVYLSQLKNETTDKALRYDLTIPFARYVAMNHNQLSFPFKRYQVQPVWRADRPQKGRYREFYQCDADVVGSTALLNELELANIYHDVFTQLKIDGYELRINSRKILAALAETCGGVDKMTEITVAIDKLDKIGLDKVKEELSQRGLNTEQISRIEKYLSIAGTNTEKLEKINKLLGSSETGREGMEELHYITHSVLLSPDLKIIIDFTLARGLNYYTGIIFEAKAPAEVKMGSIGGGGRYDDLTGLFGVPDIPGVGISFGVDRIYDVLEELKLFPEELQVSTQVLFFNTGTEESNRAFSAMQQLRSKGIRCELFHESVKFDKQFKYAEKKNIPFVVIIGRTELEASTCIVKDLRKGEQQIIPVVNLGNISFI